MDAVIRKSWPARVAAIGFIVVILAGNVWLAYALVGKAVPDPVTVAFGGGIMLAALGGLGLGFLLFRRWLNGTSVPDGEG